MAQQFGQKLFINVAALAGKADKASCDCCSGEQSPFFLLFQVQIKTAEKLGVRLIAH